MVHKKIILNKMKLETAKAVVALADVPTIRRLSLSNLERWKANDVWCSAFDEWKELMILGSDAEVIATMTGENEESNRLRQSSVYLGILDQDTVMAIKRRVSEEFKLKDLDA